MKLWPTRSKHKVEMVADLDSLLEETVSFKLHGKTHIIKPVELQEFLKFSNAYSSLFNFSAENRVDDLSTEKLKSMYFDIFSSVCETITREDVSKMGQSQIGALYQLIVDKVTGKADVDKKKTIQRAMISAGLNSQP